MLQLAKVSLLQGWLPISLFSVNGISLVLLLFMKTKRGKKMFHLLIQLAIGVITFFVGGIIAWLISDVFLVFGVSLGWLVIFSIACGFGLIGFAVTALVFLHKWRKLVAVIAIILTLLSTALQ
ncbi:MFS transporter, partial [Bifidobacteriaceae bacterium NR015]